MKKVILVLVVLSTVFISCKGKKKDKVVAKEAVKVDEMAQVTDNIDVANSVINWGGTSPAGGHKGTVSLRSGSFSLEGGVLQSGEFIMAMPTITCTDLKLEDGKEKLEGHLKSVDFFEVEKYPTAKFVITSVVPKDGKLNVTGNLTIKDITKSITIPAMISQAEGVVTFKSDTFNVDRSDFGIKYKSKKFFDNLKDKFIGDLIEFSFVVKSKKK